MKTLKTWEVVRSTGQTLVERVSRAGAVCLLIPLVLCFLLTNPGSARGATEDEVKAAIVFNFAKFVEWPPAAFADQNAPLVLGVLEHDPMAEALGALTGKTVQDRAFVVKKTNRVEDLKECQIVLFSEEEGLAAALRDLAGLPILTVTNEVENFAQGGGIINLTVEEGKIRFQVNLPAARRSGMTISSQLLKLADVVDGEGK